MGPEIVASLGESLRFAKAVSDAGDRIFHVRYEQLIQDPIETVRQIYAHFGLGFSADMNNGVCRWLEENRETNASNTATPLDNSA